MRHSGRIGGIHSAVVGFFVLTANTAFYTQVTNTLARTLVGWENYAKTYWPVVTSTEQVRWWITAAALVCVLSPIITGLLLRKSRRAWLAGIVLTVSIAFLATTIGAGSMLAVGEFLGANTFVFALLSVTFTLLCALIGALLLPFLLRRFNRDSAALA